MATIKYATLFLSSYIFQLSYSQCIWTVSTTNDDEITLDLRSLSSLTFNTKDADSANLIHDYGWTMCQNGEQCNGDHDYVMVKQTPEYEPDLCYNVARWDSAILPQYFSDDGGTWVFTYANGDNNGCVDTRTWIPTFVCAPGVDYAVSTVTESIICTYEVTVKTQYACTNMTTTTTKPPAEQCIWNDGDHVLNLTVIEGILLNGISDNDPQQTYWLSPCSNRINCTDEYSMVVIGTASRCIQTIARWDYGLTVPRHSSNFGGQWEFIYTNGDGCGNAPQSVVNIFWNCNPLGGLGTIRAAREVGLCNFEIQIDSNLACS